jgi:DNA-binding phage protein
VVLLRERNIEKHFFFDKSEAQDLARKAKKAGLSESALVRQLVRGYAPREKPDEQFFEAMRQLAAIGNSMNQIARKANALGLLDAPYYRQQAEQLQRFELYVYEQFMSPDKST